MKTRLLISIVAGLVLSTGIGYWLYLDAPKTSWDCRMKHGKVQQAIEECMDKINNRWFIVIPPAYGQIQNTGIEIIGFSNI